MSDLMEFLQARLDEDEAAARAAIQGPWRMSSDEGLMHWFGSGGAKRPPGDILFGQSPYGLDRRVQVADLSAAWEGSANGRHIARWDPARVLAEVKAKRRIIALADEASGMELGLDFELGDGQRDVEDDDPYVGDLILRALAQPYADHPDFDPAWRAA